MKGARSQGTARPRDVLLFVLQVRLRLDHDGVRTLACPSKVRQGIQQVGLQSCIVLVRRQVRDQVPSVGEVDSCQSL
jgi:hypothetical protein